MSIINMHPWISRSQPVIVSAPMMKIAQGRYALATSAAGGFGFVAGGFDLTVLKDYLGEADDLMKQRAYPNLEYHGGLLPVGVGIQNWGADQDLLLEVMRTYPVSAVWFFAPKKLADLIQWSDAIRKANANTKIWIQIGSVNEAMTVVRECKPDVLVVQGADAGGHGLAQRAGVITLLPEVHDRLRAEGLDVPLIAAGGIIDGRGVAAALALGAAGVCMGTRFLASAEAVIAKGYQDEVIRASDGGVSTVNSTVYDRARTILGWPTEYAGRGIINRSYVDAMNGVSDKEIQEQYIAAAEQGDDGWGPTGRMTTYAGTGIGLVKGVQSIEQIVKEVQQEAIDVLARFSRIWHH